MADFILSQRFLIKQKHSGLLDRKLSEEFTNIEFNRFLLNTLQFSSMQFMNLR